jgi:hypothetical protein
MFNMLLTSHKNYILTANGNGYYRMWSKGGAPRAHYIAFLPATYFKGQEERYCAYIRSGPMGLMPHPAFPSFDISLEGLFLIRV